MKFFIFSALTALCAPLTLPVVKGLKQYFQGSVDRFETDPLMQRTLVLAAEEGFEEGDDFFEVTAAMRDTVLGRLTHLFSQSADVFEISALQSYINTDEVQRLIVDLEKSATFALGSLNQDPQALNLSGHLPEMPWKQTHQFPLQSIVCETKDMLRREFGQLPDISTIAAVLLYLRSLPNTDTVYIALKPEARSSRTWLMALLMCHPHTGRPLISKAEMSPEFAEDLQNMA